MDAIKILKRHYKARPKAYEILVRHSEAVADKAVKVADRLCRSGADIDFIYGAAMLHDIGIFQTNAPALGCHGKAPYICHGVLGAELLVAEGLGRHSLVCERHVGVGISSLDVREKGLPLPERDMVPVSREEKIICYADKFFSKDEPRLERSLDWVRASIRRYGDRKLAVFDEWVETFGL